MKLRPIVWMPMFLGAALMTTMPACNHQPPASEPQQTSGSGLQPPVSGLQPPASGLQPVKVVRPVREHLKRLSTPQPAQVEPFERTDIYARATGYVETLGQIEGLDGKPRAVDIGDRVAKDQMLAKLSVPEMEQERLQKAALVAQAQAEVGQAEASLTAAEAQVEAAKAKLNETEAQVSRSDAELKYRKSEYERYASLVKERAVRRELEDEKLSLHRAAQATYTAAKAALATDRANIKVAQAKFAQAKADLTSVQARLKVAQANFEQTVIMLNYAAIKAPYQGIITRRLVDTGAFIQVGAGRPEPLFTLARVDRLRIVAEIPEAEASLVQIGQPATFQVGARRGQPLTGQVVRFADALDSGTRTMRTEVELDGPAKDLRLGMFGSVTILLADCPDALMLPAGALLTGGRKPAVFIVANGKSYRREVELGLSGGGRVQVIHGLAGHEQVVADGKASLHDGQAVEVIP